VRPDQHQRLLTRLREARGWVPAADLAAHLGVTTRSVRNYVTAVNRTPGPDLVETSHRGYRVRATVDAHHPGPTGTEPAAAPLRAPERLHRLLRDILSAPDEADVHALADALHVSSSTIEADLARARVLLPQYRLRLVREREQVRIEGAEADMRRLIRHTLTQATTQTRILPLAAVQEAYPSYDVAELKEVVTSTLARHDLEVNEYAVNTLVLHWVIALDRMTEDRTVTVGAAGDRPTHPHLGGAVAELVDYVETQYGVEVDAREAENLLEVVASKSTYGLQEAMPSGRLAATSTAPYDALVRRVCAQLAEQYLVDIEDEMLVAGLSLHLRNLVQRATSGRLVANPLAAQIKRSHPLVHELAVFFARHVELALGLTVSEDELGFVALHIGGCLERQRARMDQPTVALLVPRYYQLHEDLGRTLSESLGDRARVVATYTSADEDWSRVDADLVVTPVEIPELHATRQVLVSPLLTRKDLEAVHEAVAAAHRRSSWLRAVHQLRHLLDRELFYAHARWRDRDTVLAELTAAMLRAGVVDESFLGQVLEREAMSPTSLTEGLAVPHSMTMDARRTAIAVCVSEEPVDWGGTDVRLVLLVAFNAEERRLFREVFDQVIVTVSEPARVRRLINAGSDYETFISALMDAMDV
jgi:lichenan operon transcriptional antiterminator